MGKGEVCADGKRDNNVMFNYSYVVISKPFFSFVPIAQGGGVVFLFKPVIMTSTER